MTWMRRRNATSSRRPRLRYRLRRRGFAGRRLFSRRMQRHRRLAATALADQPQGSPRDRQVDAVHRLTSRLWRLATSPRHREMHRSPRTAAMAACRCRDRHAAPAVTSSSWLRNRRELARRARAQGRPRLRMSRSRTATAERAAASRRSDRRWPSMGRDRLRGRSSAAPSATVRSCRGGAVV